MKLALALPVAFLVWTTAAIADSPPMDACRGKSQEGDSCDLPTGGTGKCARTTYQKFVLGSTKADGAFETREASYMKCVSASASASSDGGSSAVVTPPTKRGCSVTATDIPPNPPPGKCRCSCATFADTALLLATCAFVRRRRRNG